MQITALKPKLTNQICNTGECATKIKRHTILMSNLKVYKVSNIYLELGYPALGRSP